MALHDGLHAVEVAREQESESLGIEALLLLFLCDVLFGHQAFGASCSSSMTS